MGRRSSEGQAPLTRLANGEGRRKALLVLNVEVRTVVAVVVAAVEDEGGLPALADHAADEGRALEVTAFGPALDDLAREEADPSGRSLRNPGLAAILERLGWMEGRDSRALSAPMEMRRRSRQSSLN